MSQRQDSNQVSEGTRRDGPPSSDSAFRPTPLWLRNAAVAVIVGWLLGEVIGGTGFMPSGYDAARKLLSLSVNARQSVLLYSQDRLSKPLVRVRQELPLDAKVFIINARIEDYYLANYMFYPRRTFVDEPDVAVNSQSGAVGRSLTKKRMREIGITHLLVISPMRDTCQLIPLEESRDD
jgi:hypothetical protein